MDFQTAAFFPRSVMDAITEARVCRPELLASAADRRKRRDPLAPDGRLLILACDHPARGVTSALDSPLVMGDRQEYMGRAVRALLEPGLDGVMAHTDLIEDLLLLDALLRERNGPSLLDNRLIVGCMNRGGIHDVEGELHDRFTSFSADSIARLGLDGGKMLVRTVDDEERTLLTVDACARAVTDLSRRGLLAFVEPLPMRGTRGQYASHFTVAELVKWTGVCAALGETSVRTWLKLPYVAGFEQVARATTLPILLLGGPARQNVEVVLSEFEQGLRGGNNVRGAMVGRNVLFPGGDDPLAMAAAVNAVVHRRDSAADALQRMPESRGTQPAALSQFF
jgi:DhnA family fructose-bisphosphate aldolase class Ia